MIQRLTLVLALLIWAPAHAALDVDFGRYHALVIGINDYQNLPRLETAVNDASAVADVLRQKYGFKVELLLNPTRDKVIRTLDRLRRELTERDNLLIYYAGHGVLDVEADAGFWMSVDAEEENPVRLDFHCDRNQHGQGDVGKARDDCFRFLLFGEAHARSLGVSQNRR